ncbi:Pycsar system effector family protein [Paractinoplanes atraurantiacus]|uniref:Pycsar effector protein domain-containing protein n=1 Tax=Paractinoplanes atraurantiacus TaxID=1036182 RepID=A0A285FGC5_9ACTN|nr:Pycsar system effector family protein [Actinoplanes atraurantiacus]SNY09814.1 hypothetical protein SAMN05421748_101902 [Actinoplanes atraurantiacus]
MNDIHTYQINTERDAFAQPMADVQAQLARVDTKASILTALGLASLTALAAICTKANLHPASIVGVVCTVLLISSALLLLGMAIRPNLDGNSGFVRYAAIPHFRSLISDLYAYSTEEERAKQLHLMARSAYLKYWRVRRAVDTFGCALATAGLTAILIGLGW